VIAAFVNGESLDLGAMSPEVREQIEAATPPEQAPDAETIQRFVSTPAPEPKQPDSKPAAAARQALDTAQTIGDRVFSSVGSAQDRVSRRPTPGGIAVLVIVLLILVWAVIPVNTQNGVQYTRLGLLWLTLTGKTYIEGRRDVRKPFLPDQNTPVPPATQIEEPASMPENPGVDLESFVDVFGDAF
jgi:hypothetical protein